MIRNNPCRVIIFTGSNPHIFPGGSNNFILNLTSKIDENIYISYHYLPDRVMKIKHIPKRPLYFIYTGFWVLFNHNIYDLIISNCPEASFLISLTKNKFVHIFHGNTNPVKMSKFWFGKYFVPVFDFFEKRIIQKASKLYTVGEKKLGAEKLLNPIPKENNEIELKNRKDFYFVGRLEKVKNIDRIIRIHSLLPSWIKEEHGLIIIGKGSQEEALKSFTRDNHLEEFIHFEGAISNKEVVARLKTAKLLILASHFEGFPMVIAESLSVGLPVISTDVGDIQSLVKNGFNGFCINKAENDSRFVDAILMILKDYENYAKNAYKSSEVFNAQTIADKFTEDILRIAKT